MTNVSASVPTELRQRMLAVSVRVNWSAVARRAFEGVLAEIEDGTYQPPRLVSRCQGECANCRLRKYLYCRRLCYRCYLDPGTRARFPRANGAGRVVGAKSGRNAEIARRHRAGEVLAALGAEYGITKQRVQQIVRAAGA